MEESTAAAAVREITLQEHEQALALRATSLRESISAISEERACLVAQRADWEAASGKQLAELELMVRYVFATLPRPKSEPRVW